MPLPGGATDKFGNRYEGIWTVKSMGEILSGRALTIRLEPLGPEGEGVEFWLQRTVDKREYHQVKRQHSGEGRWTLSLLQSKKVLTHFRQKLCTDLSASCVFVSMYAAYQLEDLAERARSATSQREFREWCLAAKEQTENFERLCHYWDTCTEQEAYEVLQRIEVETISEDTLRRMVECHLDLLMERESTSHNANDAATACDILAQFALEQVHQILTAYAIWTHLESRGFRRRDWGSDPSVVARAKKVTDHYLRQLHSTLIVGEVIHRSEGDTVLQTLISSPNDQQGILLAAEAGAGKSGVLCQAVEAIRGQGWPVLAFRVDHLDPVLDPTEIGRQLNLPGSPVTVLAALAQERECVLVLDQIDAVSRTSGRNPQFFDCIEALILQTQTHRHMHLILACRTFDLENDSRIRRLVGKEGVATTLPIGPLDPGAIKRVIQALGFSAEQLTQKQKTLLANPFHLSLLAEIAHTSPTNALSFQTAKDLYYQFWDAKEAAVSQRLGYTVPWSHIMDVLSRTMSEQQRLFVAESVVDQFRPVVRAMVSEHVLIQQDRKIAFFHESFFDYVFARRFAAQGRRLVPFLCDGEQHLFRRAQARQILLHEREVDRDYYLDDLQALLTSSTIRFHLKQIVLALLISFPDPTEEEWTILAPLIKSADNPCASEIWRLLPSSLSWFCLLDALGVLTRWLASGNDERIEQALRLLAFAQKHLSDRVAELIEPYQEDETWRVRLIALLQYADLSAGRRFFELFLGCIKRGWLDETKERLASQRSMFWTLLLPLPTQCPEWAGEAIGRYFDRCLKRSVQLGETNPFDHEVHLIPYNFHGNTTLIECATRAPLAFYQQLFPFLVIVMGLNAKKGGEPPWQDTVWGNMQRQYGGGSRGYDALLYALEHALSSVAKEQPEKFVLIAGVLRQLEFETAHYLLLRGYTANGEYFANAAADYLSIHTANLAIGYNGDAHRVTRELIEAISPHCSDQAFSQLEQRLLRYYPAYEHSVESYKYRAYFGQPTLFGYAQFELLEGIVLYRRTRAIRQRIAEWRRKFPREEGAWPLNVISASIVGSPIPDGAMTKMTDKQWLRAIDHYQHDTPQMQRNGTIVGGVLRVASQLERQARENPHRFATLIHTFPDETHPDYFNAVLRGIAQSQLDMNTMLNVWQRCHALPDKPCGYWICTTIAQQAEQPLPQKVWDIVAWYATEGTPPKHEEWRTSVEESLDSHTDPITTEGRMSVRGNAAVVIAQLIAQKSERRFFFLPTLARMVADPSLPVRSCVALALRAIFTYDPETALSLSLQLCQTEDILLQTSSIEQFIALALHTHFATVDPILQRMRQSSQTGVTRVGARLVCVAALITEQAHSLAESCLNGSEAQRIGAAEIFALHLRLASFRVFCEQALVRLFDDPSAKVREQVATCFQAFEGEQLGDYQECMKVFVQSQSFVTNPYPVIHALESTDARLPEIICFACETCFRMMDETPLAWGSQSMVRIDTLGKLLLRVYSQQKDEILKTRCLDLIDHLLQHGEYSLSHVLEAYDR